MKKKIYQSLKSLFNVTPSISYSRKMKLDKGVVYGIQVEDTVCSCNDFRKFQKIVKLSNKYRWVEHENGKGTTKFDNKAYRVFASLDNMDGRLLKCDGVRNPAKFGNTPDKCFICNDDIRDMPIPSKLDRQYYVDLAIKRLRDFGVVVC